MWTRSIGIVWLAGLIACTAADDGSSDDGGGATGAGSTATTAGASLEECDDASLVWHTGNKTTYESYPDPNSDECTMYNGCEYIGQFYACDNTMPQSWVMAHDIAAVFPLGDLALHRLCLRSGDQTMIVTVVDTCADSDCEGCCTENRGGADALVDLEKYTNDRWGLEDGSLEWADLGPGDMSFDGCN